MFGRGAALFGGADREREVFLLASALGLGPRCILQLPGGRVEEFLAGARLGAGAMRHPGVAAAVAHATAEFHVRMTDALEERGRQGGGGGVAADGPALWRRMVRWHAEAVRLCGGARLAELGLGSLPEEVRPAAAQGQGERKDAGASAAVWPERAHLPAIPEPPPHRSCPRTGRRWRRMPRPGSPCATTTCSAEICC